MTETVTIPKAELQRLRLESLFMKQAKQRGLFLETAREFAERAAESPEFALNSQGNLDADDWTAGVFVDSLHEAGKHDYLFQPATATATATPEEQRKAEAQRVNAMTPRQKLEYANRQAASRRRK